MKLKNLLLSAVLLGCAASPAMATIPYYGGSFAKEFSRVNLGYEATFTRGNGKKDFYDNKFNFNGLVLKYNHGWRMMKSAPLYLEAGLRFTADFWSAPKDPLGNKASMSMLTLGIPVNVSYQFPLTKALSLQPYTGFGFKFNLMANYKYGDLSYSMFSDKGPEKWKRFQMGWQIGLGVNFTSFYLGLEYGIDFLKLGNHINTSHLEVSVGYNF